MCGWRLRRRRRGGRRRRRWRRGAWWTRRGAPFPSPPLREGCCGGVEGREIVTMKPLPEPRKEAGVPAARLVVVMGTHLAANVGSGHTGCPMSAGRAARRDFVMASYAHRNRGTTGRPQPRRGGRVPRSLCWSVRQTSRLSSVSLLLSQRACFPGMLPSEPHSLLVGSRSGQAPHMTFHSFWPLVCGMSFGYQESVCSLGSGVWPAGNRGSSD